MIQRVRYIRDSSLKERILQASKEFLLSFDTSIRDSFSPHEKDEESKKLENKQSKKN